MATAPKVIDSAALASSLPDLAAVAASVRGGTLDGWTTTLAGDGSWLAIGPSTLAFGDQPPDALDLNDLNLEYDGGKILVYGAFLQHSSADRDTNRPVARGASLAVRVTPVASVGVPVVTRTFVNVRNTFLQDVAFPRLLLDTATQSRSRGWLPLHVRGADVDVYFIGQGLPEAYLVFECLDADCLTIQQQTFPALRKFLSYLLGVPLGGRSILTWSDQDGRWGGAEFLAGDAVDPTIYRPLPCGGVEWQLACEAVNEKCYFSEALAPERLSAVIDRYLDLHDLGVTVEYLLRFPSAPVEMRGALLSVALESLTSHMERAGLVACENPVSDEEWRKLLGKFVTAIGEHVPTGASRSILVQRVAGLNRPSNSQKLLKPFEVLGVALDKESKAAIDRRNKLLHEGRLLETDPAKRAGDDWKKAYAVEMRIYNAVNQLMLKYLGYTGLVTLWSDDPHGAPTYVRI